MTEPQTWTLIGLFATVVLGGMSLQTVLFMRTLQTSVAGLHEKIDGRLGELRGELTGRIDGLRGEFTGLRGEFTGLRGEFTGLRGEMDGLRGEMTGLRGEVNGLRGEILRVESTLGAKIDHLDRDVSTLMRREWDGPAD